MNCPVTGKSYSECDHTPLSPEEPDLDYHTNQDQQEALWASFPPWAVPEPQEQPAHVAEFYRWLEATGVLPVNVPAVMAREQG